MKQNYEDPDLATIADCWTKLMIIAFIGLMNSVNTYESARLRRPHKIASRAEGWKALLNNLLL